MKIKDIFKTLFFLSTLFSYMEQSRGQNITSSANEEKIRYLKETIDNRFFEIFLTEKLPYFPISIKELFESYLHPIFFYNINKEYKKIKKKYKDIINNYKILYNSKNHTTTKDTTTYWQEQARIYLNSKELIIKNIDRLFVLLGKADNGFGPYGILKSVNIDYIENKKDFINKLDLTAMDKIISRCSKLLLQAEFNILYKKAKTQEKWFNESTENHLNNNEAKKNLKDLKIYKKFENDWNENHGEKFFKDLKKDLKLFYYPQGKTPKNNPLLELFPKDIVLPEFQEVLRRAHSSLYYSTKYGSLNINEEEKINEEAKKATVLRFIINLALMKKAYLEHIEFNSENRRKSNEEILKSNPVEKIIQLFGNDSEM